MKSKKPREAEGGPERQISRGSPAGRPRLGLPLPNALLRLWTLIVGPPPRPRKRPQPGPAVPGPPSARTEPLAPVEEELPMPEKSELPLKRSEEPTQTEDTAGHAEHREAPASEGTPRAADILARALMDAEAALVSAAQERPPAGHPPTEATKHTNRAAPQEVQSRLHTLTEHFDHTLDRMAEERKLLADEMQSTFRSLREYFDRAEDRMDHDRRFLTEQVMSLTRAVERLERRLEGLPASLAQGTAPGHAPPPPADAAPAIEGSEPVFTPSSEGLTLVISSVPGFQGLMEAQRALTRMPAIEGASVERYFDGEARVVLTLSQPVTARRLVEPLSQATGQQAAGEEARPEDN